ncbi:hypothetical protein VNI00_006407 [Paramarasmius palmivorus]|uniref:Uncharacterized protein n=1 Tax=Paramarasmius palmivorus TaxID=297713 RepID=A0AAW0D8U3_9AGAR
MSPLHPTAHSQSSRRRVAFAGDVSSEVVPAGRQSPHQTMAAGRHGQSDVSAHDHRHGPNRLQGSPKANSDHNRAPNRVQFSTTKNSTVKFQGDNPPSTLLQQPTLNALLMKGDSHLLPWDLRRSPENMLRNVATAQQDAPVVEPSGIYQSFAVTLNGVVLVEVPGEASVGDLVRVVHNTLQENDKRLKGYFGGMTVKGTREGRENVLELELEVKGSSK